MTAVNQNLFRLEIETTAELGQIVNLNTGASLVLPRAREICIEIVLLKYGALDPDIANVSSIVAEVKAYQSPNSAPLISVTTAAINTALNDADRAAKTNQHATIVFTEGMTGLDMSTADAAGYKTYDLVITGTRSGKRVSFAKGSIQFLNDGGQTSGNTPTAGDPTYYTKADIDGLLAALGVNLTPGNPLITYSPDGHQKREIGVDNDANPTDTITNIP